MRFSIAMKFTTIAIGCLFVFQTVLNSQTYSFNNFGAESDIPSGFVYSLVQADNGFLWVATGSGLARFDGHNFYCVPYPDSLTSRYTTVSLKDKSGRLWFGCSDGSVYYSSGNKLSEADVENSKSISDIVEGPDGLIYVIPQGQAVIRINPSSPDEIHKFFFQDDPVMFSASFTNTGSLLIGTQMDLLLCDLEKDSVYVKSTIGDFDYSSITAIHQIGENPLFIIGTDGNGLFKLRLTSDGHVLSRLVDNQEMKSLSVQSVFEDSDNNIWVSTFGSGVIQFSLTEDEENAEILSIYNIDAGLSSNDVKAVYQDVENNYWVALYGEGISVLSSYAYGYYQPGRNSVENNILYVNRLNDNYLLGTPDGYHIFNPDTGKSISYTSLLKETGSSEIASFYLDKDKNLWIGTAGKGLYVRKGSALASLFYRSGDSGSDFIKDIEMDEHNIWLATTNGVIVLDKNSGVERQRFDISNGLPHNSINKTIVAGDGKVYIGLESDRFYMIDNEFNISSSDAVMVGSTINKILSFAQGSDGSMWAATKGNGVFKYYNDSIFSINRTDDLMSNYCYSVLADSYDNIWIGHEKGISRYNQATGTVKIIGGDVTQGGLCNPDGMYGSDDGKVFIGTTGGVILYDRMKDRSKDIAPFTNINYIDINDVRYDYQPSFSLPYSKKYVLRVNYSGINFKAPDKVYYSTFLENYDVDWTILNTSREVSYSLSDGKYKFNLISVNETGMAQEQEVSFDIFIQKPFWRTWWFILASIIAAAGMIVLIIRKRDREQKKIQEYLEEELAARTSVVMKQKGEIELQNLEITDSINYAKRIQSSILPDITKLKESFKDAFILFHPRDIVSGDFYWFDRLDDDRFVIVCADSTGHGVPGAFMSMIGSTLLQDIVSRKRISRPSEILTLLDKQIFSTLNQNVELGVSNDGMDMVVCEFNIKTRFIRFASAMRPVILVLDGESYYIKGNRSSVGGESVIEKYFDDQEYYLKEGDLVYLFSDGLPDQFGGVDGKKMKIARLKQLIEQVSKLTMDEQKDVLTKFFYDWKGSYEQVDDVLLMGIRV